jgi:hypothetical protein
MNSAENIAAMETGVPLHQQPDTGLHALVRSLYATVHKFCPSWEEWQVAVDLYPVAREQPGPT